MSSWFHSSFFFPQSYFSLCLAQDTTRSSTSPRHFLGRHSLPNDERGSGCKEVHGDSAILRTCELDHDPDEGTKKTPKNTRLSDRSLLVTSQLSEGDFFFLVLFAECPFGFWILDFGDL